MENKNMPEVRFPGFSEAWEQRTYGEVIDLLSGQDFSPSEYNDTGDGIPYMTGASCIVGKETIVNRWTTVPRCLAEKGDVLLVCKGSGYGAIAVMAQDKAHIARQFMALKTLPDLDKVFNFYLLNSVIENIKKDARGLIAGLARDAVIKQEISIPLLAEQAQIGSLLKTFDNTITLQEQELATLKQTKQGFLQKMFPKEGESVPEVRFSGFDRDWKRSKLSNLAEFTKGRGYSKGDLTDKGVPIILYGRLYTKYETIIKAVDTYTASERDQSVISKGKEVIVPSSGETSEDISRASVVNEQGILLGGDLNIIRLFKEIDPIFLALSISNGETKKDLIRRAQGKSVVHLHNSDLKEVNLPFPSLDEQTQIGNFFKQLDEVITLHQQELQSLQQTKKAFLQKMFV